MRLLQKFVLVLSVVFLVVIPRVQPRDDTGEMPPVGAFGEGAGGK